MTRVNPRLCTAKFRATSFEPSPSVEVAGGAAHTCIGSCACGGLYPCTSAPLREHSYSERTAYEPRHAYIHLDARRVSIDSPIRKCFRLHRGRSRFRGTGRSDRAGPIANTSPCAATGGATKSRTEASFNNNASTAPTDAPGSCHLRTQFEI